MTSNHDQGDCIRYRTERDALGRVRVPADAYYGSDTQRTLDNFAVSGVRVPTEFIDAYLMLKKAAAIANMRAGKLDRRRGKAIVKACDMLLRDKPAGQFPIDIFQAGAGTSTNMNVNEVVANTAIGLLGGARGEYKTVHPNDHVNMSQSTNDTYPSVINISSYLAARRKLIPALRLLEATLYAKSREFSSIVKVGRTHLQDAVPMTLGEEFSGYAATVGHCAVLVDGAARGLLELPLGGTAVGTGMNAGQAYARYAIAELRGITGVAFRQSRNRFAATQNRLEVLALNDAMKESAVALMKIANDFRILASGPRGGIHELLLPSVMPGSSIMPGKVNPSIPEMLGMVCLQVIGMNRAVTGAVEGAQLELNVFSPVIAYDTLFGMEILSNAVRTFSERCVRGTAASRDRISRMLEEDLSVATALNPYIGYAKAAQLANAAYREGKTIKEVCMERGILDSKTLDAVLDPRRMALARKKG